MGKTHGHYGTITYRSWQKMIQRCNDPNNNRFYCYGGRGIRVHGPWMDFRNFLADMGKRPSSDYSIDRIDPEGHYEPGNCRWIKTRDQAKGRRCNIFVEHNGERLTVTDWGRRIGVKGHTISRRLRNGWPVEKALTAPPSPVANRPAGWKPGNSKSVTFRGKTQTIAEWAKELGMDRVTLWQRLSKYNWTVERAMTEPLRPWAPGKPRDDSDD